MYPTSNVEKGTVQTLAFLMILNDKVSYSYSDFHFVMKLMVFTNTRMTKTDFSAQLPGCYPTENQMSLFVLF